MRSKKRSKQENPIIVIPTRGRAKIGTTWKLFPEAILFMHKDEVGTYRDAGIENKIVVHKCKTSSTARNYILDYYPENTKLIMMDDDIKNVGKFIINSSGKTVSTELTPTWFLDHLINGFNLCEQSGAKFFGVAPTTNPLNYRVQVTVGTFVNGPCMGIVTSKLRFDEKCYNKSDYDFTLQHLKNKILTFRLDYLWQKNDYNKMDGGTRFYRTKEKERETYLYLLGKWPGYLRPNPKREMEFILRVKKTRGK